MECLVFIPEGFFLIRINAIYNNKSISGVSRSKAAYENGMKRATCTELWNLQVFRDYVLCNIKNILSFLNIVANCEICSFNIG